mmetsp:Transcript_29157/g.35415  ORF Transcript_29157/g.35415 Transcript_29157/m.35415 type:complete len:238 (-) Transcript_29157:1471-2184(-)
MGGLVTDELLTVEVLLTQQQSALSEANVVSVATPVFGSELLHAALIGPLSPCSVRCIARTGPSEVAASSLSQGPPALDQDPRPIHTHHLAADSYDFAELAGFPGSALGSSSVKITLRCHLPSHDSSWQHQDHHLYALPAAYPQQLTFHVSMLSSWQARRPMISPPQVVARPRLFQQRPLPSQTLSSSSAGRVLSWTLSGSPVTCVSLLLDLLLLLLLLTWQVYSMGEGPQRIGHSSR